VKNWEPGAAVAVVSLATFELWKAYENHAPTLAEARRAEPHDLNIRQRMLDADMTVGSLAVIIGGAYAAMTKDFIVLVIMVVVFGALTIWRHSVLAAESR
jgi:hypothetical protein